MYLKFFDLTKKPFQLTPDPYYLYLTESHKEAIASLAYAVSERKGFMALFGEVGTGKTTVVRTYLARANRKVVRPIYVFDPNVRFVDLVKTILLELGEEPAKGSDLELTRQLSRVLIEQYQKGAIVVLIVDESHLMPVETLVKIRLLSNLETAENKLLQLVMSGPPEFEEHLKSPELRQLNQRFAVKSRLQLLTPEESMLYISHRITRAGGTPETIFSREAIEALVEAAGGSPRVLNILCDNALVNAFAYEERPVSLMVAREVIADYYGDQALLDSESSQRAKNFQLPPVAPQTGPAPEASGRQGVAMENAFVPAQKTPLLFGVSREQDARLPEPKAERKPKLKTWLQRVFTTEEPNGSRRVSPLRVLGTVGACVALFMILNIGETRSATTMANPPALAMEPNAGTAFSYPAPKIYSEPRIQAVKPYRGTKVAISDPASGTMPSYVNTSQPADQDYQEALSGGYSAPVNVFMSGVVTDYPQEPNTPAMPVDSDFNMPVENTPAAGGRQAGTIVANNSGDPDIPNYPVVRTVRKGDSLSELCAKVYGTSKPWILKRVMDYNPDISSTNEIKMGFKIFFPEPGEPPQL